MKEKLWNRVQVAERDYHEQKDASSIRDVNIPYWKEVLRKVYERIPAPGDATRVLDIGCGGCGILLAVEKGKKTGIDPLMDFYLEKFPFLKEYPVTWLKGKAEDLAPEGPTAAFDLIFMVNTLDHVADPSRALDQAIRRLAPGGKLVIVLNCHNTVFFRNYYSLFFRFIDPHHPHHFTKDDLVRTLGALKCLKAENIDSVWLEFSESYENRVLRKKTGAWRKLTKWLLNPFRYPIAFAKLFLGMPAHRKDASTRSIFGLYLFVFEKT